ncbi:MAG TPA: GDP-mannose 4,6-dehydratase [Vicinamibacterales bacterium]|nr:GDP-mannose 4,6-dehydratase [Vicinamibacterales bacterium]
MAASPLLTGATGFAGSHLLDLLLNDHAVVHAWFNPGGRMPSHASNHVRWQSVDLLDAAAVEAALREASPSVIYHCAGVADVQAAWRAPARALEVNAVGTHRLLDAAARAGFAGRVLVTGSALVYERSTHALTEEDPLAPVGPYALSKLAQEMAAERSGLDVVLTRSFNHAGPRQDDSYVTSAFARQIADIERGTAEPVLRVGNLDARRDVTDVRDVVRAYRALASSGRPHTPYNVCRGQAYRVGDLLDILLSLASVAVDVQTDPARLRPSDNPVVLGSHARLTRDTGWTPSIAIEQTLADILDYWRAPAPAA